MNVAVRITRDTRGQVTKIEPVEPLHVRQLHTFEPYEFEGRIHFATTLPHLEPRESEREAALDALADWLIDLGLERRARGAGQAKAPHQRDEDRGNVQRPDEVLQHRAGPNHPNA